MGVTHNPLPWATNASGVTNMTRGEAASFCRNILTSQTYRDGLEKRLLRGDLPPALECLLWHYAFGKPVENVNVNVNVRDELSSLPADELLARADEVRRQLQESADNEAALEAEYSQL